MLHASTPRLRRHAWPSGDMVSTGCARTLERAVRALEGVRAGRDDTAATHAHAHHSPSSTRSARRGGGFREPQTAGFRADVEATTGGRAASIDNRRLARVAKLAGAPGAPAAGVTCGTRIGGTVVAARTLYTVHAQTRGELAYALGYARSRPIIAL